MRSKCVQSFGVIGKELEGLGLKPESKEVLVKQSLSCFEATLYNLAVF